MIDNFRAEEHKNKVLNKLREIDAEINNLLTNKSKDGVYNQIKTNIIEQLDSVETEIMKGDWNGRYNTREKFRPLIYGLYKKLNHCAPKRSREQYKLPDREYQPPESFNRNDFSNCPEEEFTETDMYLNESDKPLTTIKQQYSLYIDIEILVVFIDKFEEESYKFLNLIKQKIKNLHNMLKVSVHGININEVSDSSFMSIDYIIFYFPKSSMFTLNLCLLNRSDMAGMIGWIIKLNDTGKCLVLNKPKKFKFFNSLKFSFNNNLDTFINFLVSLSQKTNTANKIKRDLICKDKIPWFIYSDEIFQEFYEQHKHMFKQNFKVVLIYDPPGSNYWTLILELNGSPYTITNTHSINESNAFGSNRNVINKIRAYDTEMLHRVHKLRKRLKKETDPKIRRKLLKKYNELTKIIN